MVAMAAPFVSVGALIWSWLNCCMTLFLTLRRSLILTRFYTTVASGVVLPEGMLASDFIAQNAMPIDFIDLSAKSAELLDQFDDIFKK